MNKTWLRTVTAAHPINPFAALFVLFLLFSFACRAQDRLAGQPLAAVTDTPQGEPGAFATRAVPVLPSPSSTFPTALTPESNNCTFSPLTAQIVSESNAETWLDWIEKLSGTEPVVIDGEETTITTRYSPAMFSGQSNARAFEFVLETVQNWYPPEQIAVMPFTIQDTEAQDHTWYNLSVTLPGVTHPDEIVILSAHLDSTSNENPGETAPGAEDNGSGSAALLEAARLFQNKRFERTIQIIWFTGEEQGLLGSRAFVKELENPQAVVGVINLDMFGYDSDNDACFEIHAGTLAASEEVGQCFVQSIDAYHPGLERYDYLTEGAIDRSDHGSFWAAGIGAIEILENMFDHNLPQGCPNGDPNSTYHTPGDTVDKINPGSGIAIVRTALATVAGLAVPVE